LYYISFKLFLYSLYLKVFLLINLYNR